MRRALLLSFVLVTMFACSSCGRHESRPDPWYAAPPAEFDRSRLTLLDKQSVIPVRADQSAAALARLAEKPAVLLTDEELRTSAADGRKPESGAKPYLVRCLSSGDPLQQCRVQQSGDTVSVGCGTMSHHDVTPDHAALILFLKTEPQKVYVTFSVAE